MQGAFDASPLGFLHPPPVFEGVIDQSVCWDGGNGVIKVAHFYSCQGDVHDIGKNIVKLFMSVAGFEVIDVGRDVPVRTFIQTAQKENADIIAASTLMTTTMVYMPELIKQLKELGIREQYKVMLGGAPVIKSWAQEVGSDGYGLTAKEAVQNALGLMK